jgi:hypothetical protein
VTVGVGRVCRALPRAGRAAGAGLVGLMDWGGRVAGVADKPGGRVAVEGLADELDVLIVAVPGGLVAGCGLLPGALVAGSGLLPGALVAGGVLRDVGGVPGCLVREGEMFCCVSFISQVGGEM